jgi:hypothetical protein
MNGDRQRASETDWKGHVAGGHQGHVACIRGNSLGYDDILADRNEGPISRGNFAPARHQRYGIR